MKVKITKELKKLIKKYISNNSYFESRYLNFEVGEFYEWHYVMDAIQIVNKFNNKLNIVDYYNQNKHHEKV